MDTALKTFEMRSASCASAQSHDMLSYLLLRVDATYGICYEGNILMLILEDTCYRTKICMLIRHYHSIVTRTCNARRAFVQGTANICALPVQTRMTLHRLWEPAPQVYCGGTWLVCTRPGSVAVPSCLRNIVSILTRPAERCAL